MVGFPSNPVSGQQYLSWQWDGIKWAPAPQSFPSCGYFGINGASPAASVIFSPYKGNLFKLNGVIRQISTAGIISSATNCFLNGVGGSTLTEGVLYFVYVFDNAGTLALDFSTTVPVFSSNPGNVGTPIKSGDETRTLVGVVYTGGVIANPFYDSYTNRLVRSYWNRRQVSIHIEPWVQGAIGAEGVWTAIGQMSNWVQFTEDVFAATSLCSMYNTSGATAMSLAIGINGNPSSTTNQAVMWSPNAYVALDANTNVNLGTNSYNTVQLMFQLNGASPAQGNMALYGTLT